MEQTNAWYDLKTKQEVLNRTVFEKIEVCTLHIHRGDVCELIKYILWLISVKEIFNIIATVTMLSDSPKHVMIFFQNFT